MTLEDKARRSASDGCPQVDVWVKTRVEGSKFSFQGSVWVEVLFQFRQYPSTNLAVTCHGTHIFIGLKA
jgi:frataxin-like iron-binding protein CyaY